MDGDFLAGVEYVLVAVAAFVLGIVIYGFRPLQRFKYRNIPGPSAPWLVGEVDFVLKVGQPKAFQTWRERHGPGIHKMQLAALSFLNIGNPDTARKILQGATRADLTSRDVRPSSEIRFFESSILFSRGEEWKGLRATWQPMFNTGSLQSFIPIFDKAARLFVEELSWAAEEQEFVDAHSPCQDVGLAVVCQAAFGLDLHAQKADKTELSPEMREFAAGIVKGGKNLFMSAGNSLWIIASQLFPFLLPVIRLFAERFPDKPLRTVVTARKTLERASARLVQEHRASLAGDSDGKALVNGPRKAGKGVDPGSFIDLLVRGKDRATGEALSESSITQQVLSMIAAGFETTANNLSFTIYLLSRPSSRLNQEKVIAEVDALGKEWVPSYEDLEEKLPYLDACLKESLRLYPPAHVLFREAENDMTLEGHRVPKGSTLFISAFTIHNDPEVWGDSVADFQPQRWLTDDPVAAKKAKNNFFAFGDGPRGCPGQKFSQLEAKAVLARVFQRFTLELQPGQEPLACKDSITMSPKHGVFIKPVPRHS